MSDICLYKPCCTSPCILQICILQISCYLSWIFEHFHQQVKRVSSGEQIIPWLWKAWLSRFGVNKVPFWPDIINVHIRLWGDCVHNPCITELTKRSWFNSCRLEYIPLVIRQVHQRQVPRVLSESETAAFIRSLEGSPLSSRSSVNDSLKSLVHV